MLKVLILAMLAGAALARPGGRFAGHRGFADSSRRESEDSTDNALVPPNCNCSSWGKKSENGDLKIASLWGHRGQWMKRVLKPNQTIDQLQGRFPGKKMVCGTDNVTYANMCEFINNATLNTTLGIRCYGQCPCNYSEQKNTRRGQKSGDSSKMAICLNNNITVHSLSELKEALKANQTVGFRCFGECSECATALQCPQRHHRRESQNRFRRHPQSNVTAPNCTCPQSDSPQFQQFLNSSCGRKYVKNGQVCGSDNVTYANECEFRNNQSLNATLGKRCRGPCPCDFDSNKQYHHSRMHNSSWSLQRNDSQGRPRPRPRPHPHPHPHPYRPYPLCLNNGTTIYGWKDVKNILKANTSLGIRCKGECSECQNASISCPMDWVKIKQEDEKSQAQPPNCTCPRRLNVKICGNDNVTYANICELVNNQSSQPTLGFRCLGQCPCKNRSADVNAVPKDLMDESEQESESGIITLNPTQQKDANEQMSEGLEEGEGDAVVSENSEREKRSAEWEGRRPDRRPRPYPPHPRNLSVCLTNGETVNGWKNISEAFLANSSIGIRCIGDCESCANNSQCPRFPSVRRNSHGNMGGFRKSHGNETKHNLTEEQRKQIWELKQASPSFEFKKAFDFGFSSTRDDEEYDGGLRQYGFGRKFGNGFEKEDHECMNDDKE